jgi:hypothetical protein
VLCYRCSQFGAFTDFKDHLSSKEQQLIDTELKTMIDMTLVRQPEIRGAQSIGDMVSCTERKLNRNIVRIHVVILSAHKH